MSTYIRYCVEQRSGWVDGKESWGLSEIRPHKFFSKDEADTVADDYREMRPETKFRVRKRSYQRRSR